MKILAVVLLVLALLLGIGLSYQPRPFDPRPGCEREFGAGTDDAQQCELRLLTERIQQFQKDRMDRARENK